MDNLIESMSDQLEEVLSVINMPCYQNLREIIKKIYSKMTQAENCSFVLDSNVKTSNQPTKDSGIFDKINN